MPIQAVGDAAVDVRPMLGRGSVLSEDRWRFGVLQLLDGYESVRKRDGADAAAAGLRC